MFDDSEFDFVEDDSCELPALDNSVSEELDDAGSQLNIDIEESMDSDDEEYSAIPNNNSFMLDENGAICSIAEMLDRVESGDTVDPYEAIPNDQQFMFDEDGEQRSIAEIQEQLAIERSDIATASDTLSDAADTNDISTTPENMYEKEIENMSKDELLTAKAHLEELSQMSDSDILAEVLPSQKDPLQEYLGGLSREQLEYAKEGLERRDPEVLNYFGIDTDNSNENPVLSRVLRL